MTQIESVPSESVRQLIERFEGFAANEAKAAELRAGRLRDSLDSFWSGFSKASSDWASRDQTQAQRFNLFRLLELPRLEKNHSKILKELLDPKGMHGQGKQLLEIFLDRIGFGHLKAKLVGAHVEVKTEVWVTEESRLDIIIRCFPWFILVIENKIGSGEGSTQTQKYWNWLKTQELRSDGERILIFLTIHGERASVEQAHCSSYLHDIRAWLEKCLEIVTAPRIREILRQYLETIEELRELKKESANGDD